MKNCGVKILVCDDDESFRDVLAFDLREAGFSVITAPDGRSGFNLMAHERPKVIVSDYKMPNGDGMEFLDRVRRIDFEQPVVIIVTGMIDFSVEEAIDQGAEAVFKKPFAVSNLIDVIKKSVLPDELRWVSQRVSTRTEVAQQIDIRVGEFNQAINAGIINIGRGGLFLALNDKLPKVDELISFQIVLSENSKIDGIGRVRWVRHLGAGPNLPRGCGIEFESLSPESRKLVLKLINDLKTKKFVPRS